MKTPLFYDSEFTGLTQHATLISLALVADDRQHFYAEFTDYNLDQVDDFIASEVIANTLWLNRPDAAALADKIEQSDGAVRCLGDTSWVLEHLRHWLDQWDSVQIWADHVAYDWVLFCQLFGGALSLPSNIHYIPLDLCTFLHSHHYDPDCNRADFGADYMPATLPATGAIHNALYDAQLSRACYRRVQQEMA